MTSRRFTQQGSARSRHGLAMALLLGAFLRPYGVGAEAPPPAVVLESLLSLLGRRGIEIAPAALNEALIKAAVKTADPGGQVLAPDAYDRLRERRRGRRRAAGLRIEWSEAGDLTVVSVVAGSPAEEAGLTEGAVIDSVDERFVSGRSVAEVLRWLDEGDADTVRVDARAPDEETVRSWHPERTVLPSASIMEAETWPKGLAYIRARGLYDDAAPSIAQRLRAWQEQDRIGVIVDLRGAGGDRIDAAVALAGLLTDRPEGTSLVIEALDGSAIEEFMAVAGERIHLPAMVLVDGETQGAAELLAAVLRAAGRGAVLIGAPTAGDCGLRDVVPFDENTLLYVRVRRVLLDGNDVCDPGVHQGIEPHIRVQAETDPDHRFHGLENENRLLQKRVRDDPVLQRAVDVLLGLRALAAVAPPAETPKGGSE